MHCFKGLLYLRAALLIRFYISDKLAGSREPAKGKRERRVRRLVCCSGPTSNFKLSIYSRIASLSRIVGCSRPSCYSRLSSCSGLFSFPLLS